MRRDWRRWRPSCTRRGRRGPFETLADQLPQRVPDDPGFPPLVNKRQFVPPKDMLAEPKP